MRRYCNRCKRNLPEEAFYKKATHWCRECRRQYENDRYYSKNRENVLANRHKRYAGIYGVAYERVELSKLYKRDRGVCQICQKQVSLEEASQDLIVPAGRGGPSTWSNSQLTHHKCNKKKGDKTMEEYVIYRTFKGGE